MKDNVSSPEQTRRELLAKMGTGLVAITVSSAVGPVSPQQARASGEVLRKLSAAEGRSLEALGDVLLPGAAKAGIAHFVDDQLGRDHPLLLLGYLDYPGPFLEFYQQGLSALESLSAARHQTTFDKLSCERQTALVGEMAKGDPAEWKGPPAPLFYFATRADALDVVYGAKEGFERLAVPYMEHISPPAKW
jgi:hypothetical protein